MTKPVTEQELDFEEEVYEEEMSGEDYAFIIGPDGELKSVFLPDELPFNPPKNIAKILKVFGIADISDIDGTETLH